MQCYAINDKSLVCDQISPRIQAVHAEFDDILFIYLCFLTYVMRPPQDVTNNIRVEEKNSFLP